jgi:hypothetical protein
VGLGFGFWARGFPACRFGPRVFGPEGFCLLVWASGLGLVDFLHVGFGFLGFWACLWVWASGFGLEGLLLVGFGPRVLGPRGSYLLVWASGLGLVDFLLVGFGLWV